MVQAGVRNGSYVEGSRELRESAELEISAKAVERAVKRIGGERVAERTAAVEAWQEMSLPQQVEECPLPLAPQVAVVEFDCGRMLIRERTRKQSPSTTEVHDVDAVSEDEPYQAEQAAETVLSLASDMACTQVERVIDMAAAPDVPPPPNAASPLSIAIETAVTPAEIATSPVFAGSSPSLPADPCGKEDCRSRFWRDHKVGVLLTMTSQEQTEDPCPQIPATFIDPRRVTKLVRELGGRGGAIHSPQEEAVSCGSSDVEDRPGRPQPRVKTVVASRLCSAAFGAVLVAAAWARGFAAAKRKGFVADGASMNWTLHAAYFSHYVPILDFIHALQYVFAAAMAGRLFAEGWLTYCRWIQAVWSGQVAQVIRELQERQAQLGAPPKDALTTDPRRVVATALGYLKTHERRMDYPRYRRLGLPLMSSHVESAVKQINRRVKGSEKFWSERGAEAMLQLRADYLSETAPLDRFWQQRQQNVTGQRSYSCTA
jgi:hypothetical protein